MEENIFNRLIDFRTGTLDEYNTMLFTGDIAEEDLYYVSSDIHYESGGVEQDIPVYSLYIGSHLIGDTYNSQYLSNGLSKRVTNPIGKITYGTTLGQLMAMSGGSISRVIDLMLFTDREPSTDEFGIISGFIPKIDVSDIWGNSSLLESWIENYIGDEFNPNSYDQFYDSSETLNTVFTIKLDPEKSAEEHDGEDTGQYQGRMFVCVPNDTTRDNPPRQITKIVDRIFHNVYEGNGLTDNFTISNITLTFGEVSYDYKLYLFGTTQEPITRIDMEYAVTLE